MKLFNYVKRYTWLYIAGLLCTILNVLFDMVSPVLTQRLVDDVIVGGKIEFLARILLCMLGVGLARVVMVYTEQITFDINGIKIAEPLQKDLFAHVQTLSASFFDKNNAGEIMSKIKSDVDKVRWAVSFISQCLIEVAFHTVAVLYCMFKMNWKLSIAPTVLMVVAGLVAVLMEKNLGKIYDEIDQEDSVLNDTASENLSGVRTVKAFSRESFEKSKFFMHNRKFYELNVSQSKVFVKYYPIIQVISMVVPVIVLIHGGVYVIRGEFSVGELSAFIMYSMNMVWPMEMLGWLMNGVSFGVASWKRIKNLYNEIPEITNANDAVELDNAKGNIVFDKVDFSRGGKEILKGISFNLPQGKTLGIMGATGSGKTSIVNLMTRMYDTTGGTITFDGVDIKELDVHQLRKNIAPVTQDVFLFSDTIAQNVAFGKRDCLDPDKVKTAIEKSESAFVQSLPEKEKTVIGERGIGLSGGQKQRLTIARALAKRTPVLILDDSTSALDMETEQKLQKTIRSVTDSSKIIIAHRISSVRFADEIIILDKGRIAERGTHESLLEQKGLYYQTWMAQYGELPSEVNQYRSFPAAVNE